MKLGNEPRQLQEDSVPNYHNVMILPKQYTKIAFSALINALFIFLEMEAKMGASNKIQ